MSISEQLDTIREDSLFRDEELEKANGQAPEGAVLVQGIVSNFGFHPERLASHRQEIIDIINQMPDSFQNGKGGGMSFLNLCMTKDGNQWGEHQNMELLVVLAIGLKLGRYCMSKDMWPMLPGAMPYVVFDVNGFENTAPIIDTAKTLNSEAPDDPHREEK